MTLLQKYNVAGPRYTSYPTVPFWDERGITNQEWRASFGQSFDESNASEGISLYIHLPFCENLCTFCGCHKHITQRHEVESPYINAVLAEWKLYLAAFGARPKIKEIHLGGGTPTFFAIAALQQLVTGILSAADLAEGAELSFEGHPNNTSLAHLQGLYNLGFRRCSFGVQDYNTKIQAAIHRIQPRENVERVTTQAREIGYHSISHDLVFGLPLQTLADVAENIRSTTALRPDRIAFYSYAHVPWIKGVGQRGYDERDLPKDEEKRALYELGKQMLAAANYIEIGMDHFALPSDSLYKAIEKETLHRNFMGYTASTTQLMVGLGMSAISDSWYAFAQNIKTVKEYEQTISKGRIPLLRGHLLNSEDIILRRHILNVMCRMQTDWSAIALQTPFLSGIEQRLASLAEDGLVEILAHGIRVPERGRPFLRNICMAFDAKLASQAATNKKQFSQTV